MDAEMLFFQSYLLLLVVIIGYKLLIRMVNQLILREVIHQQNEDCFGKKRAAS
jgi:hypothetical protein